MLIISNLNFYAILKCPEIKGLSAFFLLIYMENAGSSALLVRPGFVFCEKCTNLGLAIQHIIHS
jgi:hypothetical protein